jgi:hypothetical protein
MTQTVPVFGPMRAAIRRLLGMALKKYTVVPNLSPLPVGLAVEG